VSYTFAGGEKVTAGKLNRIVGTVVAAKTTNKTINNSTAPSNDTELQIPVQASTIYKVKFFLIYSATTVADVKFTLLGPTGATGQIAAWGMGLGTSNAFDSILTSVVNLGSSWSSGGYGAGSKATAVPEGTITIGSTAGNLTLAFCQQVSDPTNAVLYADSRMELTPI
jgi:hypothetical protein